MGQRTDVSDGPRAVDEWCGCATDLRKVLEVHRSLLQ